MDSAPITTKISPQQALEHAKAMAKTAHHDAAILVTADKNVLVGACQVRLECCKLRLQSCNLQIEHDKMRYQKAVEGFEKEQATVGKLDEATLLDFLPLVRDKSEYCTARCDLQSKICVEEMKREKLEENLKRATAELQQAENNDSDGDAKQNREEYCLPLGKPSKQTLEELTEATAFFEEQLVDKNSTIARQEETIKIDAELFFQRSCIVQEQNAKLSDMKQLSTNIPDAKANLHAEKNEKIASLEREVARLQYDNETLKSSSDALESQVGELTKKCETYTKRVERANNSREFAWDRLNTVKAERDIAENKVNTILDLNHIITSFKEQKEELTNVTSLFQKEKKLLLKRPALQDDTSPIRGNDSIFESPMTPLQPENNETISDTRHGQTSRPNSVTATGTPKPQAPEASNTTHSVHATSETPPEIYTESSSTTRPTTDSFEILSEPPPSLKNSPPVLEEEELGSFPIFGHIYGGIEGLVVWSAILSLGAILITSMFLFGHGLVYGLS